jgi:hypothetical protein
MATMGLPLVTTVFISYAKDFFREKLFYYSCEGTMKILIFLILRKWGSDAV